MLDYLIDFDTWLLLTVNGFNHEFVDPFMKAFSGRFPWVFLYVAIAAVMVWKYGMKGALLMIISAAVAVGASDYVCASIIRPVVQRLRPSNLENEISMLVHVVDGYRSGSYGFPSCHACNTFALAVTTALWIRETRYSAFILIWAIMQCYSRVYLGVHYPGDIAVGALIGSLFGYASYRLGRYIMYKKLPGNEVVILGCTDRANSWPAIIVGIIITLVIAVVATIKAMN